MDTQIDDWSTALAEIDDIMQHVLTPREQPPAPQDMHTTKVLDVLAERNRREEGGYKGPLYVDYHSIGNII